MLGTPKRDRRAERREHTRAEILQAAWDLAADEGLAAISLRDLARRVGMQAPSLYSYFDSKHAIYDAMFAQGAQEFLDRQHALEITGDVDDPLREVKAGMHGYVDFCVENPVRYQLMFQRTIPGFEPSPESYAISIAALEETRRRLARIGFDDPEVLDLLTAIGSGLTSQQLSNDPGGDRWTRLVDEAMEMFFEHVTNRDRQQPRKSPRR